MKITVPVEFQVEFEVTVPDGLVAQRTEVAMRAAKLATKELAFWVDIWGHADRHIEVDVEGVGKCDVKVGT